MRRLSAILIAAVSAIGFGQVASAADLPVKAPVMKTAVAIPYNWGGWYFGLNAGGNWGHSNAPTSADQGTCGTCYIPPGAALITAAGDQSFKTDGFTGGVQGGYNWQFGNVVIGAEADFEYFRSSGSTSVTAPFIPGGATQTITSSLKTDWLFTLRPRVGVAIDNWLFFGTGGLAVTELKGNWTFHETFHPNSIEAASVSTTKAGWVLGGGVEAMLPGKYTLGVEYLYVKFGNVSETDTNLLNTALPTSSQVFHHSVDLTSNIVRVRLNKFF